MAEIVQKPVDMQEWVFNKIEGMQKDKQIEIPQNYSYANALKSAFLKLAETETKDHKPVLTECSKVSIYNALLDMVIQGLNPAKMQCYFIAYGKQLKLVRSYFGTLAIAKRLGIEANVNLIYEGDVFEYGYDLASNGKIKVFKHETNLKNMDNSKIIGAYAILRGGNTDCVEIMNISQIKASWNMGAARGSSEAHKTFTDQMVKKTVFNRALKYYVNSSSDENIVLDAMARTTDNEQFSTVEENYSEVSGEIEANGSTQEVIVNLGEKNIQKADPDKKTPETEPEQKKSVESTEPMPGF
jgi:recombination protein RecT